jgi:CubicO group peptidase (beta-lactamase class C family)
MVEGPRSSVPGAPGYSSGVLFSDRSFGHTGFTGTSIWIVRAEAVVLLTGGCILPRQRRICGPREVADAVVRRSGAPTVAAR